MDLSRVFDFLPNNVLLANLQAYSFSKGNIRLFLSYLTNCTQRVKIGTTFSDRATILECFPQVSIMGTFKYFLSIICCFSQQNVKFETLPMTISFILVV